MSPAGTSRLTVRLGNCCWARGTMLSNAILSVAFRGQKAISRFWAGSSATAARSGAPWPPCAQAALTAAVPAATTTPSVARHRRRDSPTVPPPRTPGIVALRPGRRYAALRGARAYAALRGAGAVAETEDVAGVGDAGLEVPELLRLEAGGHVRGGVRAGLAEELIERAGAGAGAAA